MGQLVGGLAFHRFYFDLGGIRRPVPHNDGGAAPAASWEMWP